MLFYLEGMRNEDEEKTQATALSAENQRGHDDEHCHLFVAVLRGSGGDGVGVLLVWAGRKRGCVLCARRFRDGAGDLRRDEDF